MKPTRTNLSSAAVTTLAIALFAGSAVAQPDIAVSELSNPTNFGSVDGIRSYAFGFSACNMGDTPIDWINSTNRHPVFTSQLYRLYGGRFEQIGLSLAFHEFFPLETGGCGTCIPSGNFQTLGAGCSNVNSAGIGGSQQSLGLRTEINPASGDFQYPFTGINITGDAIFKRLRASEADLSTPDARYFFEGQYISPDDAAAGNGDNNASYREANINPATFSASFTGPTVQNVPAIFAWASADPDVQIAQADAPDGGRYIVGSKATQVEGGYLYEYAVYNQNSSISATGFAAPHPGVNETPQVIALGFHDVDYHSGDPVDGTDWPGVEDTFWARWDAVPPAPLSVVQNSIRWGTLYNFRFVSPAEPAPSEIRIYLDDGGSIRVPALAAGDLRCSAGDFAEPFFVLDLADLQTYINLFLNGSAQADIQEPFSVLDLADLQAFINGFVGGCN